jgi:AcrR family transcriptional regulator
MPSKPSPTALAELTPRSYHHGDLRRALMTEALVATVDEGPTGWSLRELARRVGVSHAASSRHFPDKQALITALAQEGWSELADALDAAEAPHHHLYDVGLAYIRFATETPAYFEILNRPELYDAEDPLIEANRTRVFAALFRAAGHLGEDDPEAAGIAAWALVHGLAALHLNGMLPASMGTPADAFRTASAFMFRQPVAPVIRPKSSRRPAR